ncbi:HSP20-like chaperone [Melampsora americana]|nr:HSP20-like chaperone [Melampsora americana]
MSYSLIVPTQWDDFESMFDKLVTDRYGPAPNGPKSSNSNGPNSGSGEKQGSSIVSRVLRPKIDIVETSDDFILTAELPGAKKEDISVDLQNGRLTVSSQTKSSTEHQTGNVRVSERSFGTFSRTIAVPEAITHDQIKASFTDGVLEVKVPKVKVDKETRRIQVS